MEKISNQNIEHESRNKEFDNFKNSALFASAVLASVPQAAEAWDYEKAPTQHIIEETLASLNLPPIEELRDAGSHVSFYIPPAEGQPTLIHIRQAHRLPGKEITPEQVLNVGTIQKEIYETIKSIAAGQPFAQYYPEGYSDEMLKNNYLKKQKATQKDFMGTLAHELIKHEGDTFSLEETIEDTAANYRVQNNGQSLSRISYGKLSALGKITLNERGISELPSKFSKLVSGDPKNFLFFYGGGLEQSYINGFITDVRGCENHDLFKKEITIEHTLEINAARERIVGNCFMEQINTTDQPYAVTVYGGMHNFEQEIDTGVGYLVLTPNSYKIEEYYNSID